MYMGFNNMGLALVSQSEHQHGCAIMAGDHGALRKHHARLGPCEAGKHQTRPDRDRQHADKGFNRHQSMGHYADGNRMTIADRRHGLDREEKRIGIGADIDQLIDHQPIAKGKYRIGDDIGRKKHGKETRP